MIQNVESMSTSATRPYWADFRTRLAELGDTCASAVAEIVNETTDAVTTGVITIDSVTKDSAGLVTVWVTSQTTVGAAVFRVSITGAKTVPVVYRDDMRLRVHVEL